MVHQIIFCYKDLTRHHFVVSLTNIEHARVINWKSLCCCIQYVEVCTEERAFANSIHFLFPFEKNYCWIIPTSSRNLWSTCSVARYVWMKVSASQKWWLRSCRQGIWKIVKKFEDVEQEALLDKDDWQIQKQLVEQLSVTYKLFSIGYQRWEWFERSVNGHHMSWTTGKWKSTKMHVKFFSLNTKGSSFWIV